MSTESPSPSSLSSPSPGYVTPQPGLIASELIYESAPYPSCHASTLVEVVMEGTLLAAWFGGTHENHSDVCIWLSRRERFKDNADAEWTTPVQIADGIQDAQTRFACWNPVLFQPQTGPLMLFYKVGPNPRQWWGMKTQSHDGGQNWSVPVRLPKGILGPIKNKPIQLPDGTILCPASTEDSVEGWQTHFEITHDLGHTWKIVGPINDGKRIGIIQPSLLTYPDGRLQALCRSQQGFIVESWSADNGASWSPAALTSLPNPNSGTDAVTLADGRQLLVYNHTTEGRSPLNVALSRDGKDWQAAFVLEEKLEDRLVDKPEDASKNNTGEYSYPAVIQTTDGLVHITYTWHRTRIKHVVLDPAKLVTPLP